MAKKVKTPSNTESNATDPTQGNKVKLPGDSGLNSVIATAIGRIFGEDGKVDDVNQLKTKDAFIHTSLDSFLGIKTFETVIKKFSDAPVLKSIDTAVKKIAENSVMAGSESGALGSTVNIAVTGDGSLDDINNGLERLIQALTALKVETLSTNIEQIAVNVDQIKDLYDNHVHAAAEAIKGGQGDLQIIQEGQDKAKDTALSGNNVDQKDIEASQMNAQEICGAIALMALTMVIGGLIIKKHPEIVVNSLIFGATLAAYLTILMIPIGIMYILTSKMNEEVVDKFSAFLIKCTLVLLIGALFMTAKGLPEGAIKFAIVFTAFMFLITIPLALMSLVNSSVLANADKLGELIVKLSICMTIGAIIMYLDNGKFILNAMKFGVALGIFILLVLTPLLLVSKISDKAFKSAEDAGTLIAICAATMIIGALFMTSDKLWKGAFKFAVALGVFLTLCILPILMLGAILRAENADKTMAEITKFIVCATIIMLIGSLFMQSDKLWKNALKFALVLDLFLCLVLLPFALFKNMLRQAMHAIKNVLIFIMAATFLMIIGALIVYKETWIITGALAFAAMLAVFIAACLLPISLFGETVKAEMPNLLAIAGFITLCALVMVLGPWAMNALGIEWTDVLAFTVELGIFVAVMGLICIGLVAIAAPVAASMPVLFTIGGAIALFSVAFLLAHLAMSQITLGEFGELVLYVGIISLVFAALGLAAAFIAAGGIAAVAAGVGLMALCGALVVAKLAIDSMPSVKEIGKLTIMIGLVGLVFGALGLISPLIASGSIAALAMSIALVAISAAFWAMNKMIDDMPTDDELNDLIKKIGIVGLVFGALGLISPLIAAGSVAGLTMSLALVALSAAFSALNQLIADGPTIEEIEEFTIKIGITGLLFAALGLIAPFVASGSVAGLAMSVALVVISAAFWAMNELLENGPTSEDILTFTANIGLIGALFTALGLLMPIIVLGSAAGGLLAGAIAVISGALYLMGQTIDLFASIDTSKIKDIGGVIKDFIDSVADAVNLKMLAKLAKAMLAIPEIFALAAAVGMVGRVVADTASLKVATAWDKDGNATSFTALNERHFELCAAGVEKIVSTLGDAIINLYTKKPEMFEPKVGRWWEKQKSPFELVVGSCMQLGGMVSNIAQGIEAFASMKVPIKWNDEGKPIDFRSLKQKDIDLAKTNIGGIVSALAESIGDIVLNRPDLVVAMTDICLMAEDENEINIKSPFTTVLSASTALGSMVSSLAAGIQDFAALNIPVYNSKGEVIGHTPMSPQDFDLAKQHIQDVLVTVFNAVQELTKDTALMNSLKDIEHVSTVDGGLFGDDEVNVSTEQSPFMKLVAALGTIGGFVGTMASVIGMYAKNQYVVGNTVVSVSTGEIKAAKGNIVSVLCAMIGAVAEIADAHGAVDAGFLKMAAVGSEEVIAAHNFMFDGDPMEKLNIMKDVTVATTEILQTIADKVMGVTNNLKDFKPEDFLRKTLPALMSIMIGNDKNDGIFGTMTQILESEFVKTHNDAAAIGDVATLFKQLAEMIDALVPMLEAIKKMQKVIVSKEFSIDSSEQLQNALKVACYTSNISKVLSDSLGNIDKDTLTDISDKCIILVDIVKNLGKIKSVTMENFSMNPAELVNALHVMNLMNDEITILSNLFNSKDVSSIWFVNLYTNKIRFNGLKLLKQSNELINVVKSLAKSVAISVNEFNYAPSVMKSRLETLGVFKEEIRAINGLFDGKTITTGKLFWKKTYTVGGFKGEELIKNSSQLLLIISTLVKASDLAAGIKPEGFNILTQGVLSFINDINSADTDLSKIKEITEEVDKYVKSVNKVNVVKLNTLNTFVEKLDILSQHVGSLDKLAAVLSEELTKALDRLATEMMNASAVVKKSEQVQQERHKLIDASVEKIKAMMDEPLKVNVHSTDDTIETDED